MPVLNFKPPIKKMGRPTKIDSHINNTLKKLDNRTLIELGAQTLDDPDLTLEYKLNYATKIFVQLLEKERGLL